MATTRCLSCMKEISTPICPHCCYPKYAQNDEHQLSVGTLLRDRYRVGRALGQGGFGITYLGWDETFQRIVAIKEFYPSSLVNRQKYSGNSLFLNSTSAEFGFLSGRDRFLREAQALSKVEHIPQIVRVYDFFQENNTAYIVMEYIRGIELGAYIEKKGGKLTVEETLQILKPILTALEAVHRIGLVHRDISPDNIMLDYQGSVKLLDFGAVRTVEDPDVNADLTKSTEAIVKHGYAPVEQYRGRGSLGPWTDCYALCATVYRCLTGLVPPDALALVMHEETLDWSGIPGLTEAQRLALEKGMSPNAAERYKNIGALRDALYGKVPAPEPIPKTDTDTPKKVDLPRKKQPKKERKPGKKAAGWVAAIVILAVIGCASALLIPRLPAVRYRNADSLVAEGQFLQAAQIYEALGAYKNSEARALSCRYSAAEVLMEEGSYQQAAEAFEALGSYRDSQDMAALCRNIHGYNQAEALMAQSDFEGAAALFASLGDYADSQQLSVYCTAEAQIARGELYQAATGFYSIAGFRDARERSLSCWQDIIPTQTLDVGNFHIAAVKNDGTVITCGSLGKNFPAPKWTDLVSVDTSGSHMVGLREDGTVVATGLNKKGACEVSDWTNIVAVSTGIVNFDDQESHTVGLKADGTVVATGSNDYSQCDVSGWTDIVSVSAGRYHTVGLKADGTVIATGRNDDGQCEVSEWTDIIAISAGGYHTVGLKADGTVIATGGNYDGQCEVSEWTDIVSISAGYNSTLGLRSDGTFVRAGRTTFRADSWTGLSFVAGDYFIVGLMPDGSAKEEGWGDVHSLNWTDIRLPH